uniref:GLOBIN domain-containing protein n=1 Tax=Trichuris muris TaxID=70415 RepID=A0A5S6QWY2_TRIMR
MEANSHNGQTTEIIQPEFTPKEFAIAELTWAKLKLRFNNQVGLEIFRQIFASCSQVKGLFGLQNKEDHTALGDQRMARHTAIFQDIIELLIVDLSKRSDSLTQSLITLGAQHWFFNQRGFRPEYWVIFGNVLVNLIRSLPLSLSQRYLARRTWVKLIVYLLDCVLFGYLQQMSEVVKPTLPAPRESV